MSQSSNRNPLFPLDILAASFNVLPMALITLGLLSTYLALAFVQELLEGIVPMPIWAMSLSIFHLYGNPIFLGMNWTNFLGMTGVAVVLLVISLVQFRSVDVELG